MGHQGYYAIIPATVRYDKDITPLARLLYGEITALCNQTGECWAKNAYFAELYKVEKTTISRWVSELESKGYIETKVILEDNVTPKRIITLPRGMLERATPPLLKRAIPLAQKSKPLVENNTSNNTEEVAKAKPVQETRIEPPVKEQKTEPVRVDWAKPKSDLQRFMGYYLSKCAPSIYEAADKKQVNGFFRQYGRMFSSMLATAGSLDCATIALDEAIKYFGSKGFTWGLGALNRNWGDFVNVATERKRSSM